MFLTDEVRKMVCNARVSGEMSCGVGCVLMRPDRRMWCQIRSDNHLLATPGGKVEKGESPLQAVKREVREEMGITLRSAYLYDVIPHTSPSGKNYLTFCFVSDDFDDVNAERDPDAAKQDAEVTEMMLMYPGEFNSYPDESVFPPARMGMDALTNCGAFTYSYQNGNGSFDKNEFAEERMVPYVEMPDTPTEVVESCMCAYTNDCSPF